MHGRIDEQLHAERSKKVIDCGTDHIKSLSHFDKVVGIAEIGTKTQHPIRLQSLQGADGVSRSQYTSGFTLCEAGWKALKKGREVLEGILEKKLRSDEFRNGILQKLGFE